MTVLTLRFLLSFKSERNKANLVFLAAFIPTERGGMEYNMSPLSHVKQLTQKDAYSLLSVMLHLSVITLL